VQIFCKSFSSSKRLASVLFYIFWYIYFQIILVLVTDSPFLWRHRCAKFTLKWPIVSYSWKRRMVTTNFCICECRFIAIVRVPEVCKRALSQSVTAYRWNDVMIIISKWRFTEGWNKGTFVNLQLKLNINAVKTTSFY
jgi:hypothetical protein